MKTLSFILITILLSLLTISCADSAKNKIYNSKSFDAIEQELKQEFGHQAYYTELLITHNKSIGCIVNVTLTNAPELLKLEQWSLSQGDWEQNSELLIEVPIESNATDFMFQLDKEINLFKLGGLVETSKSNLTSEKLISNPILHRAFINFPKNGNVSKTEYVVILKVEHDESTYTFSYNLNGDLTKIDH